MKNLPSDIFDSPRERKFISFYQKLFSISEIKQSLALQFVFAAQLFSYYVTFSDWIGSHDLTLEKNSLDVVACWPYFQNCGDYFFLQALPFGHSQTIFYMFFFGLMVLVAYLIYRRDWFLAHITLLPLFLWHATVVLGTGIAGNYDYYLMIFGIVTLFFPHKLFFIKLNLVLFYFLSTAVKLHEGWVLGTYFSALKYGLPIFPAWSIPFWTNLVIFMEMVAAWFLFSRRVWLQRSVFAFFVIFHLYSGTLVQYHYPSIVLPTLVIVFGIFYRYTPPPLDRRSIAGWTLVALLCALQSISFFIPGDTKLTMEGNRYGLYMFEANHQCVSQVQVYFVDGHSESFVDESSNARKRCDPWRYFSRIKKACEVTPDLRRVAWQFDHSINGGPFMRIVDESNACGLDYKPFSHNEWIKTEKEAEIIGYPVENVYY